VVAVKSVITSVTFSTVERVEYEDPVVDSTVDPIVSGLPVVGFGLTVVAAGLAAVCGLTFCVDATVVDDGAADATVDLYVVLDGFTTGLEVENVAVTVELCCGPGRIDVIVVCG